MLNTSYIIEHLQPDAASSDQNSIPGVPKFETITLGELVRLGIPKRQQIVSPIIPVRGLAMLYAARGIGKTHVALGLSYAVSSGTSFLRWHASEPRRVLYVDGEMPAEALERARQIIAASPRQPPSEDYFRLLSMDQQALGTFLNLAKPEHQAAIEPHFTGVELLVIDNISTLVSSGRENDADSWNAMQAWLLQPRRQGISVLLIHHAGRGENARGTSKREDVLDTVIQLKRPDDYDPEEGARFEVHLTKARGVFGDDAMPFEAKLEVVDGQAHWTCNTLQDRELGQVEGLSLEGKTVREIADQIGLSKSKVHRMQLKLRAEGRLRD